PSRDASLSRSFVLQTLVLGMALITCGAVIISLLNFWFAAGYLLYAGLAKLILEPRYSANSFFGKRPCYSGLSSPSGNMQRSHLALVFLKAPLLLVPTPVLLL